MAENTPTEAELAAAKLEKERLAEEARIAAEKEAALTPDEKLQAQIQKGVEAALAPMKTNLDNAYARVTDAEAKVKEFERKEREAELLALEEAGKHKEAFDKRSADKDAENALLKKQNVELTRDIAVRESLRAHDFRNTKAVDMAFRDVVPGLVQDADGKWVHSSGKSIDDVVLEFVGNPDNSFLLKTKVNSGGGFTQQISTSTDKNQTSVYEMEQGDVLKQAAAGKLRRK